MVHAQNKVRRKTDSGLKKKKPTNKKQLNVYFLSPTPPPPGNVNLFLL